MVCRQQMGTWEHVLPLFVPGCTVLFPTCSDNVLNVSSCGYTCTRILYPVTNSVPTYLRLERPRRRGRTKRPGTLFVTGYNMRVHTANCSPTFPTFDAPNKLQPFFFVPTWVYGGTGVPYVPGSQRNMGCAVLGRGAEPPHFGGWLLLLEPGLSHVTWVHYDATMCLACLVCSISPVLQFLRFDLFVL